MATKRNITIRFIGNKQCHFIKQLKRLKELEEENLKLKKMYANLALDNEILRDVIEKKI